MSGVGAAATFDRFAQRAEVAGRVLRWHRERAGLEIDQASELLEVEPAVLALLEEGYPTAQSPTIERLAVALGTDSESLRDDLHRVEVALGIRGTRVHVGPPTQTDDPPLLFLTQAALAREVEAALGGSTPPPRGAGEHMEQILNARRAGAPTGADGWSVPQGAGDRPNAMVAAVVPNPETEGPEVDTPPVEPAEPRAWDFRPGDGTPVGEGLEVFNALASTRVEGQRRAKIFVSVAPVKDVVARIERYDRDGLPLAAGSDTVAVGRPTGEQPGPDLDQLPEAMIESLARLLEASDR